MTVQLIHGDCLEVMAGMADGSVDAVCTDPPYHLTSIVKRFGSENAAPAKGGVYARSSAGFMGQQWDGGDIAFRPETWAEVLRVLKPGGYMAAFASTRGYHRMACAIEDAGFTIHPMLGWITGQGFPKSHKVHAEGWEGWRYGVQSLKPALEPICLAQRPFSEKTGTANVLAHGTGALNIDACRVAAGEKLGRLNHTTSKFIDSANGSREAHARTINVDNSGGARWPANVLHDSSPEVLAAFEVFGEKTSPKSYDRNVVGQPHPGHMSRAAGDLDMRGRVESYGDTGTAARFFASCPLTPEELSFHYSGKVDSAERGGSTHPTMKPISLMSWLVRLITPPGGTVLDMFLGSGSTAIAADREGFHCIGIEQDEHYLAIARSRIKGDCPLFAEVA